MVEIVLGVWIVCFILSMCLVTWNYFSILKKLKSSRLINVNLNLKKINQYWSVTNENFETLEQDCIEKDKARALKSAIMLGFLGLTSFIGFLLLLAIVVSLRFLIKERRTTAVFQSELAKNSHLLESEVESIYKSIREIN